LGIIDYFQLYTLNKQLEKMAKKVMNVNLNLDTSSQDVKHYANRFIDFFQKIAGGDYVSLKSEIFEVEEKAI